MSIWLCDQSEALDKRDGVKAYWLFPHPALNYWITHGIHLIFVNLRVVEIEIIIGNFLYPFTSISD